jgi:hypothetical protein
VNKTNKTKAEAQKKTVSGCPNDGGKEGKKKRRKKVRQSLMRDEFYFQTQSIQPKHCSDFE